MYVGSGPSVAGKGQGGEPWVGTTEGPRVGLLGLGGDQDNKGTE